MLNHAFYSQILYKMKIKMFYLEDQKYNRYPLRLFLIHQADNQDIRLSNFSAFISRRTAAPHLRFFNSFSIC